MGKSQCKTRPGASAAASSPVVSCIAQRQHAMTGRFLCDVACWPSRALKWNPAKMPDGQMNVGRSPGRPWRRWDDFVTEFSNEGFSEVWHEVAAADWMLKGQQFVNFVSCTG